MNTLFLLSILEERNRTAAISHLNLWKRTFITNLDGN